MFVIAPAPLIPVPEIISGFSLISVCPFKSSIAPLVTFTCPTESPNAVLEAICSIPAETVVPPLKEFVPDRVRVPVPVFVSVTPPPAIMPVIEPALAFATDSAAFVAKVMSPALNVPVVIVKPASGLTAPTAAENVVAFVVLVANTAGPSTVELKLIAPPLVEVRVESAATVTAPK